MRWLIKGFQLSVYISFWFRSLWTPLFLQFLTFNHPLSLALNFCHNLTDLEIDVLSVLMSSKWIIAWNHSKSLYVSVMESETCLLNFWEWYLVCITCGSRGQGMMLVHFFFSFAQPQLFIFNHLDFCFNILLWFWIYFICFFYRLLLEQVPFFGS